MSAPNAPSTAFSNGSRISLFGLQKAAHLNNRKGIIISAPAPGTIRYQVYLFRASNDWSSDPIFVRAQPANIKTVPHTPSNNTASPRATPRAPPSLPPPHPLRTLARHHVLDTIPTRIVPTTNFFGTVPPTYLLRGIPLTAKSARILVLACGDIRSLFYTVSRRTATHGNIPKLRLTLNDNEPSIMARNILLLWLVIRTTLDPPTIYEIWFSLRLSARAYAAIVDAVAALTGPHSRRELRRTGLTFHSDADRAAVYRFFDRWSTWGCDLNADILFGDREEVMNAMHTSHALSPNYPHAEELAFRHHIVGDITFPKDAATREIKQYVDTGCVAFKHAQHYLNPTMFKSPDEYSLHLESLPFNAFPPFAPHYDKNTPLRTASLNHLREWVYAMRQHGRNNEYIVSTTDCLEFAMACTERFDIVAMSNITDVVGLLPILQATRGLVAPSGYMFTQTFRSTKYKGYIEGYLRTSLGLPLEFVPAVLGWRCVGWEGKNNPDHCVVKEAPGSDGRSCETMLTWQPAAATNVPLDAEACAHVSKLYTTVRDRLWTPLRSHPEDLSDGLLLLRVVNPLVLIPIFASAYNVAKVIDPGACLMDVEISDILGFITTGTPSDLMLASVALPRRPLQLWGFEPTDPRDFFTVRLDSGVPYAAIKMHLSEETNMWTLTWIMSRERARGVDKGQLMYTGSVVVRFSMNDVSFSELSRDQWSSWLRRASRSPSGAAKVRRIERDDSCDIIFDVPQDCIDAARNNNLLVRRDQHCNHSIEVVNKDHGNGQKKVFHLPYPIDRVRGGLQVEASREAKFEVLKAKYSLESLFLSDSHNKACSFKTTTVPSSYVTWLVTQQFSPNELLRSELGKLQWTSLCSCKGIASSILMTAGNGQEGPIYLQSEDEETGRTQALVLFINAMRREECTGNLAVDVKWMHKPILVSPRALRNSMDWPSHAPMTDAEFQAVLKMLEVRSEHEPETETVQDGGDFLMKSSAMCREFPGLLNSSLSGNNDHETPGHSKMQDRMHLLCGGRIGYATVTVLMWPGQVALLEREGNSLVSSIGMDFKERVEGWLKRGREHKRRGDMGFALLAYEQGAAQGLSIMRLGQRVNGVDALIECLLEAAATRLEQTDEKNFALISACCNKAIELVGNSQTSLRRKAERLLSKTVDVSQS